MHHDRTRPPAFMYQYLKMLAALFLQFTDELFDIYRDQLKREYDNFAKTQPYQQCLSNTASLLQSVRTTSYASIKGLVCMYCCGGSVHSFV